MALSLIAIVFQLMNLPYEHYYLIWIPLLVLSAGVVNEVLVQNGMPTKLMRTVVLMVLVIVGGKMVTKAKDVVNYLNSDSAKKYSVEANDLIKSIPESGLDSVIAYNTPAYFYITTGINPCYKYCILQDWQCGKSEEMNMEFKMEIESLKAKYIVIVSNSSNRLDDYIRNCYEEIDSTDNLILLKR